MDEIERRLDRPDEDEWKGADPLGALVDYRVRAHVDYRAEASPLVNAALDSVVELIHEAGEWHLGRQRYEHTVSLTGILVFVSCIAPWPMHINAL